MIGRATTRPGCRTCALALCAAFSLLGPEAAAQAPTSAQLRVLQVTEAPRLDGTLSEPFWHQADSIWNFRQREPNEGSPASERTVVRVVRTDETLYVGVWAYDRDPGGIIAKQYRRDASVQSDDRVALLIDGMDDQRGGFEFETNPNGIMVDAQITGVQHPNIDWNGIWDVATSRNAAGWTAEFRIPLRTLRFHAGATTFGFNVRRDIARKNERDLWQSYGRSEGLYHLIEEGTLTGLGGLHRKRSVTLRPFVLGRGVEPAFDTLGVKQAPGTVNGQLGVDAKIAVAPTLTADLTVNPDFAQVEADHQVINLTRFPLHFPEKREFFLESSGIFSFGFNQHTELFYSRRIGLSEDSAGNTAPVPIIGGARLYGRVGRWTVGALGTRTGGLDDATDAVVRIKRDIFARSYVGTMATLRSAAGGAEGAVGFDADFPLVVGGQNIEPTFWLAGTHVPGTPGIPTAWRVATDFPNDLFNNFVSLYHINEGYTPTLGFMQRTGIWETTGHINFQPRPHVAGLRRLDLKFPIPDWTIIAPEQGSLTRSGDWETAQFEWRPLGGEFESGDRFEVNLQRELDAPTDTFDIFSGVNVPPGRYWWTRWEVQVRSSEARAVSVHGTVSWGGFYDGRSTEISLQTTWRPGGRFILSANGTRTRAHLPEGTFTATQLSGQLEWDFSTRSSFLAFVQWNNENQRLDFNLRYHWIPTIGDDVYVVWNSGYATNAADPFRFPNRRSLTRPLDGALVFKVVHRLVP